MLVILMYGALLAAPLWAVAVVIKAVSVILPGRRPDWVRDLVCWSAGMAAAGAVMTYAFGVGAIQGDVSEAESGAGSLPAVPCRSLPPDVLDRVAGHEPSYFPLGFDCLLDDGSVVAANGSYTVLNTVAAAFALAAVLALIAVGCMDEYRARTAGGRGGAGEHSPSPHYP